MHFNEFLTNKFGMEGDIMILIGKKNLFVFFLKVQMNLHVCSLGVMYLKDHSLIFPLKSI